MRSEEIVVSNGKPWNIGIVSCFRFPGSETRMQLVRHRCGAWSLGDSNITLSESHIFRKKQNREDEWTSWGQIFFCMRILRSNCQTAFVWLWRATRIALDDEGVRTSCCSDLHKPGARSHVEWLHIIWKSLKIHVFPNENDLYTTSGFQYLS